MKRPTMVFGLLMWVLCANAFQLNSAKALTPQEKPATPNSITAESLKPHVTKLADDNLEGRGAGYRGERKAADYIAGQFKQIGLRPFGDTVRGDRTYFQKFKFLPRHPPKPWETLSSQNILGFIEGTDPSLKYETVVIGAHYDGQGRAGQADPLRLGTSEAAAAKDEIWNSANDNAASVAAILEIARAIKTGKLTTRRSILFIAFGAEEHGMAGSMYYVAHPVVPLSNHVAMINLEKLGRSPEKPLSVTGAASSSAWAEVLKAAQAQTKMKVASASPFSFPDSDHYPFAASRVPAVMFYVQTSLEAHYASDTSDKIDFVRVAESANFAMASLLELANRSKAPDFIASPIPDLGLIAHLVTDAEADAAGLGPEASGLKVTAVVPGLPAAEAGLKEGDLIVEFVKRRFRRSDTVAELMGVLQEILKGKFGSELPVTVLSNKKESQLVVHLRR